MEFSKLIFLSVWLLSIGVTIFAFILMFETMDTSALAYLIPSVFAEMATGTAFYYNKAKIENKLKIMNQNKIKITKEDIE